MLVALLSGLLLYGGSAIRPYTPPQLAPEPDYQPTDVRVVEIVPANDEWDATVLARPAYSAPLAGHVLRGAHIAVRGGLEVARGNGCPSLYYYALEPNGWICSTFTKPSERAPTQSRVLKPLENSTLPYRYIMVLVDEESSIPMWTSLDALRQGHEPERRLYRGDTVAVADETVQVRGESYHVGVDGQVLPTEGTRSLSWSSDWQGVELKADTHLPFGWVSPQKAPVYDAPKGRKIDLVERRERLDILDEATTGAIRWVRVGEDRWMNANHLNEVRKIERPKETGEHPQWFDVDLGEQVVVAYVHDQPAYATLTSSGRPPNRTPRGNYPIWGKASAITMKSQAYDEHPYYVNRVPWVMFFQAHNALHGAYWHDRFGGVKSHGCVNLSPKDARYMFEWLAPTLPPGWTAIRYWDLTQAPVAHVRNSKLKHHLVQERNIGPPNKTDEAARLERVMAQREAKAREEASADGDAGSVAR